MTHNGMILMNFKETLIVRFFLFHLFSKLLIVIKEMVVQIFVILIWKKVLVLVVIVALKIFDFESKFNPGESLWSRFDFF